jgi:hypothetical protein
MVIVPLDHTRFRIFEEAICVCLRDYETLDHLVWHCERFETKKRRLAALDVQLNIYYFLMPDSTCGSTHLQYFK